MNHDQLNQALLFLAAHNEVALATCDGDRPQIRSFQIMHLEGTTLYFATSARKDVYQQLRANPHMELLSAADQVSVRCKGDADFTVDDAVQQHIFLANPVLPRLYDDYRSLAYFRMDIAQLDYYDLKPTPPTFLHFDLQAGTMGHGFVGDRYSTEADTAAAQ